MRAKKSLGQNFLVDPNYQRKILRAVQSSESDTIVEIGPGRGAITQHLLTLNKKLVLIEKDTELARNLEEQYAEQNVKVVCGDFLDINLDEILNERAAVVGNLPYNVSTQIFIKLLSQSQYFDDLFLMFQKEVAQRCVSPKGGKTYGVLSLWTKIFSDAEKLFDLPPTAFKPQPKVTSSFVKFKLNGANYAENRELIKFIKLLFSSRRKKIATSLKKRYRDCDLSVHAELVDKRPEQLTLEEFRKLYGDIKKHD